MVFWDFVLFCILILQPAMLQVYSYWSPGDNRGRQALNLGEHVQSKTPLLAVVSLQPLILPNKNKHAKYNLEEKGLSSQTLASS